MKSTHWQCRIVGGPVVNFYPTTGRINVQGKEKKRQELMRDLLGYVLQDKLDNPTSYWITSER